VLNSKKGLISAWIKPATATSAQVIFTIRNATGSLFTLQHYSPTSPNKIIVQGDDNGTGNNLLLTSTDSYTAASGWLHIMASWDTSLADGVQYLYINRKDATPTVTRVDGVFGYETATSCVLGSLADGTLPFLGSFYDLAFWPGTYLDLSTADNRSMLVSNDGRDSDYLNPGPVIGIKPVGYDRIVTAPVVHFGANPRYNRGTGGAFTTSGTFVTVAAGDLVSTSAPYDNPAIYRQSAIAGQGSPGMRWFDSARGGFSYPKSEAVREPDGGAFVGRDEADEPSRSWPEYQTYWSNLLNPIPEEDRGFPPPWLP